MDAEWVARGREQIAARMNRCACAIFRRARRLLGLLAISAPAASGFISTLRRRTNNEYMHARRRWRGGSGRRSAGSGSADATCAARREISALVRLAASRKWRLGVRPSHLGPRERPAECVPLRQRRFLSTSNESMLSGDAINNVSRAGKNRASRRSDA
jgi:hypothetical protein